VERPSTVSKCNIKSTKIKDILKHAEALSSKHKITKQHSNLEKAHYKYCYQRWSSSRTKKTRSYKTFDIENFNDDIEQIKINQTCHEVDSV
jgi:hypothetical protein